MDNLCILPLSSMESVFHFICGSTGSVVCFNCFTCVAFEDLFWGTVSGVGVLIVQSFFKVVGNVIKACGHWI